MSTRTGNFRNDCDSRAVGSGPYELVQPRAGQGSGHPAAAEFWGRAAAHPDHCVQARGRPWHRLERPQARRDRRDHRPLRHLDARAQRIPQVTQLIDFQRFYMLSYNFIAWNNRNPLLSDKRVRRALSMCIPIDAVIQDSTTAPRGHVRAIHAGRLGVQPDRPGHPLRPRRREGAAGHGRLDSITTPTVCWTRTASRSASS